MTQAANQAEAEAAQGSETETPQGAQSDSLNNPGKEQNFNERVAGAKTPADVQRLIREAVEGSGRTKATQEEQSPASETPAEGEKPAEGEQPAEPVAEETPAAGAETKTGETPAEAAAGEKPKDDEAGDDDEVEPIKNRVRITDFDEVAKLAIGLKKAAHKRGETITLAEAEKRAAAALGVNQSEKPAGETAEANALPQTVEAADAKIKALVALRTKAFKEDLDFAAGDTLTNEIEALREHKLTLREKVAETATKEQAAYNAAFDAAEKKANALYEFVKQPESAAFKRMAEIDQQLEANRDPLFNAPDKALVIAQMVARELQIAPKSPNAKPVAVKPVAKAPTVVVKKTVPPVVGGDSRTSTSTTQGGELTKKIQGLRTPAEVEDFIASLAGR